MSVTLDSGALIVALQDSCKSDESADIERHHRQRSLLIPYLDSLQSPYLVPAVAFAEFLFGIPEKYKSFAISLGEKFHVSPLTQRVAIVASQIRMELLDGKQQEEVCTSYGQDKKSFLADIYILATSKADGAIDLVTRDRGLEKKAKRLGIPCTHIDDIQLQPATPIAKQTKQPDLFDTINETAADLAKEISSELTAEVIRAIADSAAVGPAESQPALIQNGPEANPAPQAVTVPNPPQLDLSTEDKTTHSAAKSASNEPSSASPDIPVIDTPSTGDEVPAESKPKVETEPESKKPAKGKTKKK